MPPDTPLDSDAPPARVMGSFGRVAEMQAEFHRWAAAGKGRRLDDLFSFVYDPATLIVAFGPLPATPERGLPVSMTCLNDLHCPP